MKPIMKLLFVALLIGWVLSRPHVVRAGTTYYQCSAQWTQDLANLSQWMGSCMICTHEGGPPNFQDCYTLPYSEDQYVQNPFTGQYQWLYFTSSYQTCSEINQSAQQCVSSCTYENTQSYNQYFAQDCQPIS